MPTRPTGTPGRITARRVFAVLIGLQLLLGITWAAQNLGHVPGYGDTTEYLELARSLKVDPYRGIAYPALLALANAVSPGSGLLEWRGGPAPAIVLLIQLVQILVCLASLVYFTRVVVAPAFPTISTPGLASRTGLRALL